LLNIHAWRLRDVLPLDSLERHETRTTIAVWTVQSATGSISTLVAIFLSALAAPWVYATLPLSMTTLGVIRGRSLARASMGTTTGDPAPGATIADPSAALIP
jgi:hypothetical protein